MGHRTVYGLDNSENGWEMVDQDSCVWVTVPGSDDVNLQIREGQPAKIMGAFAADFNAYVERLRDADSACWTATNSVASSNHLSGTAMDLNWNSHPFQQANAGFNQDQINTCRALLDFYEDTIFWGNDWQSPKDAMHWQMGYDTYGSDNVEKVNDFIRRKIRSDGFSTFRRDASAPPPPPPPPSPPASDAVDVLARATGVTPEKAAQIVDAVRSGLAASQATNVNRIAMWLAQIGHESAGFNATEEYQNGDESTERWRYKGRTWIQLTWRTNYQGFGQWLFDKGLIDDPNYFVNNPKALADLKWAGLGAAWYWTVARPKINAMSDARDLVGVTQAINGGQNGAPDRKNRYDRALALGDQLLVLVGTPEGDDELADPEVVRKIDAIYQELTKRFPSRSPLRHVGEGLVDTLAGFVLNIDGSQHVEIVTRLAKYGDPDAIALLNEVAANTDPARKHDAQLAQAILADAASGDKPVAKANLVQPIDVPAPQVVYTPTQAPTSTGQVIGQAYDALEALKNAQVGLTPEAQASVDSLIAVLQKTQGATS